MPHRMRELVDDLWEYPKLAAAFGKHRTHPVVAGRAELDPPLSLTRRLLFHFLFAPRSPFLPLVATVWQKGTPLNNEGTTP